MPQHSDLRRRSQPWSRRRHVIPAVLASVLAGACGGGGGQAQPTTRPTATSAPPVAPSTAPAPSAAPTSVAPPTTTSVPAPVVCPPIPAPVPDTGVGPAGLMVFDTATGNLAWEVEAAGSATIAPVGDLVVAGDDAATRAYRASDGSLRWCRAGGGLVASAGGTVVVLGSDGRLAGLDPATGAERWTSGAAFPGASMPIGGLPPALTGGKQNVYVDTSVASPPGSLVAVDAARGATGWTWTPSGCQGPVCVGGPWSPAEAGLVYISDTNAGSVVGARSCIRRRALARPRHGAAELDVGVRLGCRGLRRSNLRRRRPTPRWCPRRVSCKPSTRRRVSGAGLCRSRASQPPRPAISWS